MRIGLRPFGEVPSEVLDDLESAVREFGSVERLPASSIPSEWFDASRRKFEAGQFLEALQGEPFDRVLGVTSVDLYSQEYHFVFGQARIMGRPAIVSIARLGKPGTKALGERLAKEAIHELGHTFGLVHCENRECVMWFSNTLEETDRKTPWFCRRCKATVEFTSKRMQA